MLELGERTGGALHLHDDTALSVRRAVGWAVSDDREAIA